MGFGDYPAEYIPEKHGPYDPARYYGKRKYHNQKRFKKWFKIKILIRLVLCIKREKKLHNQWRCVWTTSHFSENLFNI